MAQNRSFTGNDRGLVNVLIARFSAIGDVAMTVPVVYSACRCYPDVHFVMVTRPSMTSIFVNAPANLTVIGVDVNHDYQGPAGMRRLVNEIDNKYHIDAFVDLHDVIRTQLMRLFCRLKGKRVTHINKGRAGKRALTRRFNKVMLPLISQRARYREAFYKAGLPINGHFNGLYGGHSKADTALFAKISEPKPDGIRWIGVAPFAAHSGKVYPSEQMHQVVKALAAERNVKIFLLGGDNQEQQTLESWADALPNVQSLAGKRYGFAAELALLNHIDVVVTMDSANMHLASIAGAPTISIWGATHPYCGFKGWQQSDDDTVQLPLTCRPCSVFGDKPCHRGDFLCMAAIKPDVIIKKTIDKLSNV